MPAKQDAGRLYGRPAVVTSRTLGTMTKSELIEALARRQTHLAFGDVELAVKSVIEQMSHALSHGERIEVRGFGSFALHYRPPRMGRNPKTGEAVALPGKHVPHFKPGKELRERVNQQLEVAAS
ncbi:integration host factor subunit beta [Dyella sp.]|uniref:integration host factor subunit beta n=1 Tax=Dyella sp. TaxID=1869338 RepID=UPI002D78D1B6|nr:integration host factor subunit beta [Dyella sp.]HET6433166.1 integration host factor subunit beta [Dyella sp.]